MPTPNRRTLLKVLVSAGIAAAAGSPSSLFAAAKISPAANTALVVVDVQNCFVTGGTLPVKGGEEVVPVINKLAAAFRNIVVTQDWHTPAHASFASSYQGKKPFETTKLSYGTQVLWPDHCVQGTEDAALHKDLKLQPYILKMVCWIYFRVKPSKMRCAIRLFTSRAKTLK